MNKTDDYKRGYSAGYIAGRRMETEVDPIESSKVVTLGESQLTVILRLGIPVIHLKPDERDKFFVIVDALNNVIAKLSPPVETR